MTQGCSGVPIIENIHIKGDLAQATRRVIVRAAAEIGKAMNVE